MERVEGELTKALIIVAIGAYLVGLLTSMMVFPPSQKTGGYVTDCRAYRPGPYGVALTCKTESGFPDWNIYVNDTGGHEFTHLIENSYPFDHFPPGPPEYTVYVPCGQPSEIKVYNNQIREGLGTLVFNKTV